MGSDLALDSYKVNNMLKSSAPLLSVSELPLLLHPTGYVLELRKPPTLVQVYLLGHISGSVSG